MTTPPPSLGIDVLACLGDSGHPDTWSSTPYHLLQAGRAHGVLREGLALDPGALSLRRLAWNAAQVLRGGGHGGYQFSVDVLERLWAGRRGSLQNRSVLNQFQLFPPSIVADASIAKYFYVDGTLKQLFEYYGHRSGRRIKADAMRREREGYHAARAVVAMSRFAAASLIDDYGVPADRVHVVVPGANFDAAAYARWSEGAEQPRPLGGDRPLRLLFVGKDWRRKGLDRLLRALRIARGRGLSAELRVIGCDPASLPGELREIQGVEWCGFISRAAEGERLFRLMAECDVGCLLSRQEFSAIVLREYLALGLVVVGPDTGGCRDLMLDDASVAVSPTASDDEIADALVRVSDPTLFDRIKQAAWRSRGTATWDAAVARLGDIVADAKERAA